MAYWYWLSEIQPCRQCNADGCSFEHQGLNSTADMTEENLLFSTLNPNKQANFGQINKGKISKKL